MDAESSGVPVTVDNFARAETDTYLAGMAARGSLGRFVHRREPLQVDRQLVIRGNPDAFVSQGVFDLDEGPLTVELPDPGARLMSLQLVNQDHYVCGHVYGPTVHTLRPEEAGSRYVAALVRVLVDPRNDDDVAQVRALQDAIRVRKRAPGSLELPRWDKDSLQQTRRALLELARGLHDTRRTFGTRDTVDPVRHLIGSAYAWGGQQEEHAFYLNVTPAKNDGVTPHLMQISQVPVDGYWSVTVYNAQGYLDSNPKNAHTINNLIAQPAPDGTVEVWFGGDGTGRPNHLPVMPGWNYLVRLYRARPEVLDGSWQFPEAVPLD